MAALLWAGKPGAEKDVFVHSDDMRYIAYAVSLKNHGIFGLPAQARAAPEPGNANAPLYPLWIASVMRIDQGLDESLQCFAVKGSHAESCPEYFRVFLLLQNAWALLSLFLVFIMTLDVTGKKTAAWVAALLAEGSGIFAEFAHVFLTEILTMSFFLGLMFCTLHFYRKPSWRLAAGSGGLLALLTLTRPSYLYLFYAYAAVLFVWALLKKDRKILVFPAALVCCFVLVCLPWAARNMAQFGSPALTGGGYAEAILAQRTAYNAMGWDELAVSFLYWFPDSGDALAQKFFSPETYAKLGWGQGSYYAAGQAAIAGASSQKGAAEVIRSDILGNFFKHSAVSVALAWRGIFIAKYWGVAGLAAFVAFAVRCIRRRNFEFLVISLPLWFMVAFHAGLSVSIPRYNLPLLGIYAPAMAWYAVSALEGARNKIRGKSNAKPF